MTLFARIVDDVVIDVVDKNPAELFHADYLVLHPFVEVPDGTQSGAQLIDGEWTKPEPSFLAPQQASSVPILEFWRLWHIQEEAEARKLAETDPLVAVLFSRIEQPKVEQVDLAAYEQETAWLVNKLDSIPDAQKGVRLGQILSGIPV